MVKSWPILYLGRLIFGFGSDSFIVGNSTLLSGWFKGKELAFAFGINLAISRLGSVMNNILSPQLANNISIIFASWFAVILCGFGIMAVLCVYPVDHLLDKVIAENSQQLLEPLTSNVANNEIIEKNRYSEEPIIVTEKRSSSFSHSHSQQDQINHLNVTNRSLISINDRPSDVIDNSGSKQDANPPSNSFKDVFTLQHIFWVLVLSCVVVYGCVLPFNNISSSLLLERDFFKEPSADCQIQNPLYCENDVTNPYIHCSSSKSYQPPLPYNLTDEYNPLTTDDIDCTDDFWKDSCATSEYCSRLTDAETQASFVMSIPFIISAALSPPTGFLVDIYGCRAIIATLAPAILIIVHSFLALSTVSAVGPLVGQGLAYTAFVSVLWPSIPLVIEERMTGLAFGIAFSMQNLGCTIFPLVIAAIYSDSDDHYIPNAEFLFVGLASVGVFVGLYLNYYDYLHGNILNRPGQKELENNDDNEEKNPLMS